MMGLVLMGGGGGGGGVAVTAIVLRLPEDVGFADTAAGLVVRCVHKLQATVYSVLPSAPAIISYAIRLRELSAV